MAAYSSGASDGFGRVRRRRAELAADLQRHRVRRVVEVGRDLHRQLAAVPQRARESGQQRPMARDPLQRRIGEHDVVGLARRRERLDGAGLEAQPFSGEGRRARDHRRRAVHADGLGRAEVPVELRGQLAGAAPQVHHPPTGHRPDQSEQVVERLSPLRLESLVLVRVPGVRHIDKSKTSYSANSNASAASEMMPFSSATNPPGALGSMLKSVVARGGLRSDAGAVLVVAEEVAELERLEGLHRRDDALPAQVALLHSSFEHLVHGPRLRIPEHEVRVGRLVGCVGGCVARASGPCPRRDVSPHVVPSDARM